MNGTGRKAAARSLTGVTVSGVAAPSRGRTRPAGDPCARLPAPVPGSHRSRLEVDRRPGPAIALFRRDFAAADRTHEVGPVRPGRTAAAGSPDRVVVRTRTAEIGRRDEDGAAGCGGTDIQRSEGFMVDGERTWAHPRHAPGRTRDRAARGNRNPVEIAGQAVTAAGARKNGHPPHPKRCSRRDAGASACRCLIGRGGYRPFRT